MPFLVDELEARADSISVLTPDTARIEHLYEDVWAFELDGASYKVTQDAFEKFLNYVRIPIKYVERCIQTKDEWSDDRGVALAESNINFWLDNNDKFSFLLNDDKIVQIFPRNNTYLPGVKVNDFIIEIFDGNIHIRNHTASNDVFSAIYLTDILVNIGTYKFQVGVRVLYSDCFNITPRFDGVLFEQSSDALLSYPTVGRKFRVSNATIDQILDQIAEFTQLSIDGVKLNLAPAVKYEVQQSNNQTPASFIRRMCSDMRYSKKVQDELKAQFDEPDEPQEVMNIVLSIAACCVDTDFEHIDEVMKRNISIALGQRLIDGDSFK